MIVDMMLSGIPCALVRNWVMPVTTIWMMRRLPSRVGCDLFHMLREAFILLSTGAQGVVSSSPFPIQAPRQRTACPSGAMCTLVLSGLSAGWIWWEVRMWLWCVLVPIGMTSVFSRLNLVPDTVHHWFRRDSRLL